MNRPPPKHGIYFYFSEKYCCTAKANAELDLESQPHCDL
ncbi:hypothetical protein HOV93_37040 [Planctomycetes bacterium FF15]|uniref:Uncharacterized protein n=1 Tax=Bremerella alba TaxID=980252 RepID=A0A7V9A8P8_9BACT|nr:hypothetical protein [Bremerella alba]